VGYSHRRDAEAKAVKYVLLVEGASASCSISLCWGDCKYFH
jgi:hypothetical protein